MGKDCNRLQKKYLRFYNEAGAGTPQIKKYYQLLNLIPSIYGCVFRSLLKIDLGL